MKINFTINKSTGRRSFLHEAEILTYIPEALSDFENDFPGMSEVNVDLMESFPSGSEIKPREMGRFMGRDTYVITIAFALYPDKKGILRHPTPENVFETIKWTMKDEIGHFKTEFQRLNPPLRSRLKDIRIDMDDNKNIVANELHGLLGSAAHQLDLSKPIWELTSQDLSLLGEVLVVSGSGKHIFSGSEIVAKTRAILEVSP